ncbi:MAG: hypothetical protein Q9218_001071 [Villophora microphyllina]
MDPLDTAPSKSSTDNSLSDIFSDSPPPSPRSTRLQRPTDPSDIPRLRSVHVTNGYRDGISVAKDHAVQPGFDEAYPLGAILGLRVGYILGVLEGLCGAYGSTNRPHSVTGRDHGEEVEGKDSERTRLGTLLGKAREELKIEKLFGIEYWGSGGLWAYEVHGKDDSLEEDLTFWEVADQHPVMQKWLDRVRDEVRKAGIESAEEGFSGVGTAGEGSKPANPIDQSQIVERSNKV